MTNAAMTTTPGLALGVGASRRLVAVASLAQASRLYRDAGMAHTATGRRAGTFPEGRVYDTTTMKVVGYVSWNGRVWPRPGRVWKPEDQPLYDPAAAAGGAR